MTQAMVVVSKEEVDRLCGQSYTSVKPMGIMFKELLLDEAIKDSDGTLTVTVGEWIIISMLLASEER